MWREFKLPRREEGRSYSRFRRLWFSFDNGLLRLLRLCWGRFYRLGLDVDFLSGACGHGLRLALVSAHSLLLDLRLQPRTLFPLLLLPLMPALHLSGLALLGLLLKKPRDTGQVFGNIQSLYSLGFLVENICSGLCFVQLSILYH